MGLCRIYSKPSENSNGGRHKIGNIKKKKKDFTRFFKDLSNIYRILMYLVNIIFSILGITK